MAVDKQQMDHKMGAVGKRPERRERRQGTLREKFRRIGSARDTALALAISGRYEEAGQLLLVALGVPPEEVGTLSRDQKRLAYLAATYFSKSGNLESAGMLLEGLGETERARELRHRSVNSNTARDEAPFSSSELAGILEGSLREDSKRLGEPSLLKPSMDQARVWEREGELTRALETFLEHDSPKDAGRVLSALGRFDEAAEMFSKAGMHLDAAHCFLKVGDSSRGIAELTELSEEDPRYRSAASVAVRVAYKTGVLTPGVESFLLDFIEEGPENRKEIDAFIRLGKLYVKMERRSSARRVLETVVERYPRHPEAREILRAIETGEPIAGTGPRSSSPTTTGTCVLDLSETICSIDSTGDVAESSRDAEAPAVESFVPVPSPESDQAASCSEEDDAASSASPFFIGAIIADRYRLEQQIGTGGMSIVYRAFDLELQEDVALKLFIQQVADKRVFSDMVARFRQELKLSRQLIHPNVIRMYDLGVYQGYRYLTMELLNGIDLAELFFVDIGVPAALEYLIQACKGLEAAHSVGVVHRDIKPENLFVTHEGVVKLMDFGIAKNTFTRGHTIVGTIAGTPEYMSPEQISNFSEVTHLADLYSLGIVAYRLLTGVLPFESDELMPLLAMQLQERPAPLREKNPNISPELEQIVLRLLEKDPAKRFASCADLREALQAEHDRILQ